MIQAVDCALVQMPTTPVTESTPIEMRDTDTTPMVRFENNENAFQTPGYVQITGIDNNAGERKLLRFDPSLDEIIIFPTNDWEPPSPQHWKQKPVCGPATRAPVAVELHDGTCLCCRKELASVSWTVSSDIDDDMYDPVITDICVQCQHSFFE